MAVNPLSQRQLNRLAKAVEWSRWKLQPFREKRFSAVRQYVGANYSDDGSSATVPLNLLEVAINVYVRHLVAATPRALVTTRHLALKRSAALLELALNHLVDEIELGSTLQSVVLDALFSIGVVKVGLNEGRKVEINGFLHDVGQPYADTVHLDDWVHDMAARRWDQIQFAGNRYLLPLEVVKESKLYDGKARDDLQASELTPYNERGDERTETLSRGMDVQGGEEFHEHVELWDLWLPAENLVVTIPAGEGDVAMTDTRPLRVVEWAGPEAGPFRVLCFNEVPGNIMPLSPVALWMDLHELANGLFRKLGRQAKRQKTFTGVAGMATDDGERIVNVNDGEVIRLDHPELTKEYRAGGIDPQSLGFMIQVKDLFSWVGGNLDALGGLTSQAETLGQERLLAANASRRVSSMQDKMTKFTKGVLGDLAWHLWTDPLIDLPLVRRFPGLEDGLPVNYTPEKREGDFLDYNINVSPYSMQDKSPGERLQVITQVFGSFIAPFAAQIVQQGGSIDFEALLKLVAKYTNMDELDEIVSFATESGQEDRPVEPTQKPAQTTRTVERINRPGTTQQGKDEALTQMLFGGRQQPAQQASLVRQAG